jgi:hypothetical protein
MEAFSHIGKYADTQLMRQLRAGVGQCYQQGVAATVTCPVSIRPPIVFLTNIVASVIG